MTLTAPRTLTLPAHHRRLAIRNATTGGHAVTIGYPGPFATVAVAADTTTRSSATATISTGSPAVETAEPRASPTSPMSMRVVP
jgi:hypothetical protein